jgi:PTH2 family peptidyl-tRNA hydrolase
MSDPVKQLILIRKDLKMRRGKEIAQGAHASMKFLVDLLRTPDIEPTPEMVEWLTGLFTKVVLQVPDGDTLLECMQRANEHDIPVSLIVDSGTTEFGGVPTQTALAIGPERSSKLDPLFGMLKLY